MQRNTLFCWVRRSAGGEWAAKNAENSLTDAPTREIHYINMRRQQRRILLQVTQDAQKYRGIRRRKPRFGR